MEETRKPMWRNKNLLPAFEIDDRIGLHIEYDLARQLGCLILDSSTPNSALLALGHQLRNLTDVRLDVEQE